MLCPGCGAPNAATASHCVRCNARLRPPKPSGGPRRAKSGAGATQKPRASEKPPAQRQMKKPPERPGPHVRAEPRTEPMAPIQGIPRERAIPPSREISSGRSQAVSSKYSGSRARSSPHERAVSRPPSDTKPQRHPPRGPDVSSSRTPPPQPPPDPRVSASPSRTPSASAQRVHQQRSQLDPRSRAVDRPKRRRSTLDAAAEQGREPKFVRSQAGGLSPVSSDFEGFDHEPTLLGSLPVEPDGFDEEALNLDKMLNKSPPMKVPHFWQRTGAIAFDMALGGVVMILIALQGYLDPVQLPPHFAPDSWLFALSRPPVALSLGAGALVALLCTGIVEVVLGRSLGKFVFGLSIVRGRSGEIVAPRRHAVRSLLGVLSFLLLGAGLAWILVDRRCRAWHDLLTDTIVVKSQFRAPTGT